MKGKLSSDICLEIIYLQRKSFVLSEGSDVEYFPLFLYFLVSQQMYTNNKSHCTISKDKYFNFGFAVVLLL